VKYKQYIFTNVKNGFRCSNVFVYICNTHGYSAHEMLGMVAMFCLDQVRDVIINHPNVQIGYNFEHFPEGITTYYLSTHDDGCLCLNREQFTIDILRLE